MVVVKGKKFNKKECNVHVKHQVTLCFQSNLLAMVFCAIACEPN